MSIQTWLEEFMPVDPDTYAGSEIVENMTAKEAVLHSIKKWEGALPENLEKHNLNYGSHAIYDLYNLDEEVEFSGDNCALCAKYPRCSSNYIPGTGKMEKKCPDCPLNNYLGEMCAEIYGESEFTPQPMISALKGTLKMSEEQENVAR